MGEKDLKDKETRLIEMYIKAYITKTQFYEKLEKIRKGNK